MRLPKFQVGVSISGLIFATTTPFVVLFSIPLAIFAVFTTTVAFWVLLFRVIVIYIELGLVLVPNALLYLWQQLIPLRRAESRTAEGSAWLTQDRVDKETSPMSKPPSRASSISSGSRKRPITHSQSSVSLFEVVTPRDFEGVGGWREPEHGGDQAIWTNSQLEVPIHRHHRRSFTAGSRPIAYSRHGSPERVRTPLALRTPIGGRRTPSGTVSPEGYFSLGISTFPGTERTSNVSLTDYGIEASGSTTSLNGARAIRQGTL
ncbi:hypothetical protein BAUCODRAFT_482637 [Baudoinia panamericana UAMH 10762]|uniref:Uncharacterized protein n=1 Tax=Baudoinia panamericana (strain UAMH 10762) TaxID=717646 RepID=M2MYE9_BAUPA|nr:uncharacterized protein BAUCODRAFT_482637 [Baudoinia panamericana UAMH 10762]EMC96608.1 hypothetical protein BAUCODRAFT_482637 [Baudoinia panamericana UAMH 10762]